MLLLPVGRPELHEHKLKHGGAIKYDGGAFLIFWSVVDFSPKIISPKDKYLYLISSIWEVNILDISRYFFNVIRSHSKILPQPSIRGANISNISRYLLLSSGLNLKIYRGRGGQCTKR